MPTRPLYAGLPDQPAISPLVGCGRHHKPLALLAGRAVLAGFFHYVRVGPQRVEEDEHRRLDTTVHEVDPAVHTYDPKPAGSSGHERDKPILRYNANERTNHWVVAILFFLAGLSGLALFHRRCSGSATCSAAGRGRASCTRSSAWRCSCSSSAWCCVSGAPTSSPPMTAVAAPHRPGDGQRGGGRAAGGHNAGQKLLFWTLLAVHAGAVVTGVVIWRAYFSHWFGIDVIRWRPCCMRWRRSC
jgi:hypothetical protein